MIIDLEVVAATQDYTLIDLEQVESTQYNVTIDPGLIEPTSDKVAALIYRTIHPERCGCRSRRGRGQWVKVIIGLIQVDLAYNDVTLDIKNSKTQSVRCHYRSRICRTHKGWSDDVFRKGKTHKTQPGKCDSKSTTGELQQVWPTQHMTVTLRRTEHITDDLTIDSEHVEPTQGNMTVDLQQVKHIQDDLNKGFRRSPHLGQYNYRARIVRSHPRQCGHRSITGKI